MIGMLENEERVDEMDNKTKHLPLFGVGPFIVFGQVTITVIAILITFVFDLSFASFDIMRIPFSILGSLLIIFCFW